MDEDGRCERAPELLVAELDRLLEVGRDRQRRVQRGLGDHPAERLGVEGERVLTVGRQVGDERERHAALTLAAVRLGLRVGLERLPVEASLDIGALGLGEGALVAAVIRRSARQAG